MRQTASCSGEILQGPWKLTLLPVYDLHTGFPYSVENQFREYVGPRDSRHYPRFSSFDLQVSRPVSLHIGDRNSPLRAGFSVFNVFNHFNPRDVQNVQESSLFGEFLQRRVARVSRQAGIPVLTMKNKFIFGTFLLLFTATAFGCVRNDDSLPSADVVVARMLAHNAQRQMTACRDTAECGDTFSKTIA